MAIEFLALSFEAITCPVPRPVLSAKQFSDSQFPVLGG